VLRFEAAVEERAVRYSLRFDANNHTVPARDYGGFRKALRMMRDLGEERLVIRPGKED
jgi:hypothetical protein